MNTHFYFRNKKTSPPSARHSRIGVVLLVLAAILLTVLLTAWVVFGTQLKAAMTIQKLDDGLWYMEYKGDYGFDKFLEQGGAKSDSDGRLHRILFDPRFMENGYLHCRRAVRMLYPGGT